MTVGNSETLAVRNSEGTYDISGYKFFTSAITSEAALLLARVTDDKGEHTKVIQRSLGRRETERMSNIIM